MLYQILGEDQFILNISDPKTQRAIRVSGVLLVFNMFICMVSFFYLYAVIFHSLLFAIGLSIFSTLIIYNIYKLCLVSIINGIKKTDVGYVLSFIIRALFIGSIGLVIAQGILILLYDVCVETIYFETASIIDLVDKTLNTNNLTIVLEPILVILFLMPFLIKYFIPRESNYALKTQEITNAIIREEYQQFKHLYTKIFKDTYQLDVSYKSYFLDPPFNTETPKPTEEKFGDEKDLRLHL